jgi:hypothetical protein
MSVGEAVSGSMWQSVAVGTVVGISGSSGCDSVWRPMSEGAAVSGSEWQSGSVGVAVCGSGCDSGCGSE